MIQVDTQAYGAIWAFVAILIGAGWAAYGILGGNTVFLAIMVVVTMVLGGGAAVLLRRRSPDRPS